VSQESTNRSFDDLARALAEGSISRRGALKLFAGSAIAALIPSRALAQQQKVTICHKPGTPAEKTKEVPQSAVDSHLGHGDHRGPCEACPSGQVLCNGNCVSNSCPTGQTFNTTTCQCECPSGQVLCNGNCVSNSCLANSGQVFNSSTCQCECPSGRVLLSNGTCAKPCTTITDCTGGFCVCLGSSVSTKNYCAIIVGSGTPGPCGTDADCPTGQFCRAFIEGDQCIRAC
jgi:Cys-rich repeat protein